MSRLRFVFVFAIVFCFVGASLNEVARAGAYNPVLNVGDKSPEWKDLPGIDGKKHSLADLKDQDVVVVCFTCNSCDVATDYEDRIVALAKKYSDAKAKVAIVAVNVNKIPADDLASMKKRAEAKKFPFVYLYDDTQKIAKDFGATFTPEFFVLDKNRKIAYMGGLDDHSSATLVKNRYLETALDSVLKGEKPKTAETVAIGCMIRYERERRKKK
ncbi:MAG: thioredoxin family protein [Planctomycetia bacterium]|nr:thioredoxin family protein [Planctomycetia bacterium]